MISAVKPWEIDSQPIVTHRPSRQICLILFGLTVTPFRVRSFRFQWPADLLTSWAFEMETLILSWYVMVETGSVLLLTIFGSLQFLGTLAAPMFGVLGDRLGGRTMLCALRAMYAGFAAVLMIVALIGVLSPVWVFVLAALAGVIRPSDLVMRNALIGETIPPPDQMGAIGLSRASADSARVAGALTGAGLSAMLGIGSAYVFVMVFYAASLVLTLGVSRQRPVPDPTAAVRQVPRGVVAVGSARGSRRRELKDGLVHVLTTPRLLAAMWLAFLINLSAYPASHGLLPYVARNVYHVDATGLGWLVASFALGGLVGSITMVVTGGTRHPERTMIVHTVIWYALLLGFAHVQTLGAGIALLLLAGFFQNVALISMTAVLLAASGEGFRGRVMGVRSLAVYGLPIGLVVAGALIERMGYPVAITLSSLFGLLFTAVIALKWRESVWSALSMKEAPWPRSR
ncbi:MAG: MFS transporter [Candidatus Rokubacteria bacterium]|nr:MFS transporter [Candidatus Rokubacteria bacterium]